MRTRLFTPGPTPVPESVMLRMAQPIIHHRTPEFQTAQAELAEGLKLLFQTSGDVITLTSSGTGAMEAAVVNTLSPGDAVITVNAGKFGERWGELCRAYGLRVEEVMVEWGRAVTAEEIGAALDRVPDARAVLLTHSETSTGVATDVRGIAQAIRPRFDGLIIVDGITAVGAHELRFDEWDLDVVVTGSQKGVMIPPGLAFIALSERAWRATETARLPRFYFDLRTMRKPEEAWTPAVTLVLGAVEALRMLREEGIENVWARHDRLARALRAGLSALGLKLFGVSPSNAVTSAELPERGAEFMKLLKERYHVTVAAGQEALKGRIVRIAHLGYYDDADMLTILYAVERALADVEHPHTPGAGLAAARAVLGGE